MHGHMNVKFLWLPSVCLYKLNAISIQIIDAEVYDKTTRYYTQFYYGYKI
jgi:hypothetical protein